MRGVEDELATIPSASRERVASTLSALSDNPYNGCHGLSHLFVDAGDYRITYVIQDDTKTVVVGRIYNLDLEDEAITDAAQKPLL
jgi:mRNA-degrading endonuclease RelE of RelBE toxin-antitoxin system